VAPMADKIEEDNRLRWSVMLCGNMARRQ